MTARAIAVWLAAIVAAAFVPFAGAQPAMGRIPTVTRLVKIFSELEAVLASNVESGDGAAIEAMLVPDFELRVASMPGNPTARDEWIKHASGTPASAYRTEQMAVHDFGGVCVVSFLQAAVEAGRKDIATVDVWKRDGDVWKLAVRYAGPSGSPDFAVPGASAEPPLRKRY